MVYQAVQPGKAIFYGGTRLTGFQPVTDPAILERLPEEARGRVMRCDLRTLGITDYGQLAVRGFAQPPSPNIGAVRQRPADDPGALAQQGFRRHPQAGAARLEGGRPALGLRVPDDRAARWTKAEDAWLFGYFRYLWADATNKITKVDPAANTITAARPTQTARPGWTTARASSPTP